MNAALRVQGAVFVLAACVGVLVSLFAPRLPHTVELMIVGTCIVVLGVPHGALDTVFAQRRYSLSTRLGWSAFAVTYLVLMGCVTLLWFVAPTLFLVSFLGISVAHFSGDPIGGTSPVVRVVQAGAIVVLPTIRYANELTDLYALLVGPTAAATVVPWLNAGAWPLLVALIVAAVMSLPKSQQASLELIATGCLAMCAPPLLAFVVYFCLMHSARHVLRTVTYARSTQFRHVAASTIAPMLGVVCAGLVAWFLLRETPMLSKAVIQVLFVGLASLTVPHMALIEPIRLAGWQDHGEPVATRLTTHGQRSQG